MDYLILDNSSIERSEWDDFILHSPQGNIYHCYDYLSILIPNWKAIIISRNATIEAALPFQIKKKFKISYCIQPPFSQYHGILFRESDTTFVKSLELKKSLIKEIHNALPTRLKYIQVNFAPEFDYILPLIWNGWQHRTLITYWIELTKNLNEIYNQFASHVRREIKKATEEHIFIRAENKPEVVIELLKVSKPEVCKKIGISNLNALCAISKHYHATGNSICYIAYKNETAIAGIIYFFYKNKMIYYQGCGLPEFKNSGAMSLIIWKSIELNHGKYELFDFDGSMIESIEKFFRGFNAFPVHYHEFILNRLHWYEQIAFKSKNLMEKFLSGNPVKSRT